MKRNLLLLVALVLGAASTSAVEPITNRVSLSLRAAFNVKAKFTGSLALGTPAVPRTTPKGANYNYDDGYVFNDVNDVSGSGDGLTWYWGYDDSASQVNAGNNTILLSRATGNASLTAPEMDDDGALGFELAYADELGRGERTRYGWEAALNWTPFDFSSGGSYRARGSRVVDAYPFTPGTTPPGATPGSPYQGTSDGPGFVIGNTPVSSTTTAGAPIGTVTGSRSVDADLWGGRLGGYLEWDLDDDVTFLLSGGLALGYVDVTARWNETLTLDVGGTYTDAGRGSDDDWRLGFYLAAHLNWRLSERWSAVGGLQYQNLGKYAQAFGTRRVELDLRHAFFVTLGLGYNF